MCAGVVFVYVRVRVNVHEGLSECGGGYGVHFEGNRMGRR